VVAIQAYAWRAGVGGCFARQTLRITDSAPERLDRVAPGP